ncbi:D-alanyl-D-alanine endopeptidase [Candidimonas nitroreducens]|uniref:D-alanyl-D-alanine endopeptidase n=1 Tax=Candidimonas nitroreducens TaxID=683354 RepID=A0A225N5G4_9BURK|nr:D-alanyl-D-alanine endopeptidase [Candidimonas nitroreducens]OWT66239.1 D-alanyl-D-alanine endopeptidase [Candidimonas nitroreducens]
MHIYRMRAAQPDAYRPATIMRHFLKHKILLALLPAAAFAFGLATPTVVQAAQPAAQHTQAKKSQHARKVVHRRPVVRHAHRSHAGAAHKVSYDNRDSAARRSIQSLAAHASLKSEVAYVQDLENSTVLYNKNSDEVRPIASISKLMTALIVTESGQSMQDMLTITEADVDHLRHSRSRLSVGARLSRADMLHLALMSSENRAAHALSRYYPGGERAFVRAMNDKARALGMRQTHFLEPTGLSSENVSTPRDLVKLLVAASRQPLIHRYTTDDHYEVDIGRGRRLAYNNTNGLVRNHKWDIQISKTGFINESGECLVMLTRIDGREVAIVLLNSVGRYSRVGDAMRVRNLVERETNLAMM